MSSKEEGAPRGFEGTYQAFVWRELSMIRELERRGEFYRALEYAVSLLKYLQPIIRKKLEKEADELIQEVRTAINSGDRYDWFIDGSYRNNIAEDLGYKYLQKVVTALGDLLGERWYMEKGSVSPRHKAKTRLEAKTNR